MDQLGLFSSSPFSVRLRVQEALKIFWDLYWSKLPSATATKITFKRLSQFFDRYYLDTVTRHDVEEMRRDLLSQGLKKSTINKYITILSRLYSKMEEFKESGSVGGIDFKALILPNKNPCLGVKKINEAQFARIVTLSPIQYKFLKQFADEDTRDDLDFLVFIQRRVGDARRITENDIDWHNYQIRIVQSKTITTTNPSGVLKPIILTPEIERLLLKRINRTEKGQPLFPFSNWQKRFDYVRKCAKMEWLQSRDLKKLLNSWMADHGIDELTRTELEGHTTPRMQRIYAPRALAHLRKAKREAVEAFSK